ncbi:hypothetical protein AB833_15205 [Chromatiales bacterium (ex Bugula neritina AB1)]|nr:hypothetical protein AB833_15205 [Chromatiales bacterium (ex Bugula neritina AB1)]
MIKNIFVLSAAVVLSGPSYSATQSESGESAGRPQVSFVEKSIVLDEAKSTEFDHGIDAPEVVFSVVTVPALNLPVAGALSVGDEVSFSEATPDVAKTVKEAVVSETVGQSQFKELPRPLAEKLAETTDGSQESSFVEKVVVSESAEVRAVANNEVTSTANEKTVISSLDNKVHSNSIVPESAMVVIKKVRFEGNTVYSDDELSIVAEPFLSRPISRADLEELRVRLTRVYTDTGYLNSGAILPEQSVGGGDILYRVVEGTLDKIEVEGTGRLNERYISSRLLKGASTPFNAIKLQQNFQKLLGDPLIDRMDGELLPSARRDSTDLKLSVTRARPYNVSVGVSNHSPPSLGDEQLELAGTLRNITGIGDELSLGVNATESRTGLTTIYSAPIPRRDTRLRVMLSTSDSGVIEEPLESIDIESETRSVDVSLSEPLYSALDKALVVGAGLSIRRNSNTLDGIPFSFSVGEEEGVSRVSVARTWAEYVDRRESSVFAARTTFNLGLDAFDATIHNGDRADGEFMSIQAQLQYVLKVLEDRAQILVRLDGQFSNDSLLPLARFSLGGANSVRGYRENEVVRDTGIFSSAEFRYKVLSSAEFGDLYVAPFIDIGYGRNRGSFSDAETLTSVGVGVLWNLKQWLSSEFYYGHASDDVTENSGSSLQDNGFHFRFFAKY